MEDSKELLGDYILGVSQIQNIWVFVLFIYVFSGPFSKSTPIRCRVGGYKFGWREGWMEKRRERGKEGRKGWSWVAERCLSLLHRLRGQCRQSWWASACEPWAKGGVLVWLEASPPGVSWAPASRPCCCCSDTKSCPILRDHLPEFVQFMSIGSVVPSNHLILCRLLLLPPSIFPSIRVFSNESALHIRWPKYWSFRFSISPSSEYSGLISFRMAWLDLLTVQRTLEGLLQHHSWELLNNK